MFKRRRGRIIMLTEVRGTHSCFVCLRPMMWVANLYEAPLVLHGSELIGSVSVISARDANQQVSLQAIVVCPNCGCRNLFVHTHTVGTL